MFILLDCRRLARRIVYKMRQTLIFLRGVLLVHLGVVHAVQDSSPLTPINLSDYPPEPPLYMVDNRGNTRGVAPDQGSQYLESDAKSRIDIVEAENDPKQPDNYWFTNPSIHGRVSCFSSLITQRIVLIGSRCPLPAQVIKCSGMFWSTVQKAMETTTTPKQLMTLYLMGSDVATIVMRPLC